VTVTGASAFNSDMLSKIDVDLTDSQISALETAHEMRVDGAEREEVRTYLEDAGLDQETMKEVRTAVREYRDEVRKAVQEALENEDYDAYLEAVADTPRAGLIDSESEFEKLLEAHELREAGDHEGAREIMSELGFEKPEGYGHKGGMRDGEGRGFGGPGFHKRNWQSAE
jgi:DNA-binding transcriptional MerR regulator